MRHRQRLIILFLLSILTACSNNADTVLQSVVVTELVEIQPAPLIVEDIVTREVEVVQTVIVTPTPESTIPSTVSQVSNSVDYRIVTESDISTLDPQLAEMTDAFNLVENLFINLTNFDHATAMPVPEAAKSWAISDDGLMYTFNLRTDIPWVYHNPVTGETTQATDADGNLKFVTAADFVFGIRRACDSHSSSYYSLLVQSVIVGCKDALNTEDSSMIPPELVEAIGVSAPSADTLVIELTQPSGYFLSMTHMPSFAAVPEFAISEYGSAWTEAGNIVTSGRFVLSEWIHNIRVSLQSNRLLPVELAGQGNIDRVVIEVAPEPLVSYSRWQNGELDSAEIPYNLIEDHLANYPAETVQVPDQVIFYFGFRTTKPPFDDVRVRRAFSAAFDRLEYIEELRDSRALPMRHFTPPGIVGAPPIDEVGVGFEPEYARAQLAAAGYPNCEGFPEFTLFAYQGESTLALVEFAQHSWQEQLGCDPMLLKLDRPCFMCDPPPPDPIAYSTPDRDAAHMFLLGWGSDYPDQDNYVGDQFWCVGETRFKRVCSIVDDLIVTARIERDQQMRMELYYEIEERLFGTNGEFPVIPLYTRTNPVAVHQWLDYVPSAYHTSGEPWYEFTIDSTVREAATGD